MAGERVLVVDDEPAVLRVVGAYLEREGYVVLTASDGTRAWELLQRERPDLVVLDVMLPGVSGTELCRRIRAAGDTPVIMLTARGEETDKVVGLKIGADDYVTKPFSPRELVARVEAVLRRARAARVEGWDKGGRLERGPLVVDPERHEAWLAGRPLGLTPTEFRLLHVLARRPGRVFTRQELVEAVQGAAYEGYERTIDTHVKNLRRKLGPEGAGLIETVFGVGYRFASG